ncbi:MAG: phosphosulfolactate synthase [Terrimesophilobacter sp.]
MTITTAVMSTDGISTEAPRSANAIPQDVAFNFIPRAYRPAKPRKVGITEVRGPYYSTYGTRHLADVLEVAGPWVDGVKWAGGSFALLPREQVRAFSDLAHEHDAYISSGGWLETVLRYGPDAVDAYLKEAKEVGFDVIEISAGFISVPTSGLLRLIERVKKAGLKAKPELGIQFGSGGDSGEAELAAEGKKDVGDLIARANKALEAGADIIMIESEGITENVVEWNTRPVAEIINGVGLEHVMFESADPPVYEWYIKNYGNEVNLFVDHSQILQLEGLRQNIWGNKSTWGRIINPA